MLLSLPDFVMRKNIKTGVLYQHYYTDEEKATFAERLKVEDSPIVVKSDIDKHVPEEEWIMIVGE